MPKSDLDVLELRKMGRLLKGAMVGLAVAAIGIAAAAVPSFSALEDSLALRWLFLARGPVAPPAGVTIISIDEATSVRLGLPSRVRDWPRSIHGELVDRLVERGASAIAFDVEFFRDSPDPRQDELFSASITRARRVIIAERFRMAHAGAGEIWERQRPIPSLANAALAVAPVPLPDGPLVTSSWSFINTPHVRDVPSLAAATLQVHFLDELGELQRLLGVTPSDTNLISNMQAVRRTLIADTTRRTRLQEVLARDFDTVSKRQALTVLSDLYQGPSASFLNFYGPPGHLCTVPYDEVLRDRSGDRCQLAGSAAFIGAGASRIQRGDQQDTYHTVFDRSDGTDFSGVEIHATAFANLLTGRTLKSVGPVTYLLALLGFGFSAGGLAYFIRTRRRWHTPLAPRLQAAGASVAAAFIYSGICYLLFSRLDLVLPLAIPLLFQLPLALIVALSMAPAKHEQKAWAICLITDAANSTELSVRLGHARFSRLMFDYQNQICTSLVKQHGAPLTPQGDGQLCVWLSPITQERDDATLRFEICVAALEICRRVQPLKTRIGLDAGEVTVHSDADRGPYNLVGQPAIVAARLQKLATFPSGVLATSAVVEGLTSALALEPHSLHLDGIPAPVEAFEITGPAEANSQLVDAPANRTAGAA